MFSRDERDGPVAAPAPHPGPLPDSPVARLRPRTAPQLLDAGFEVIRFRARTITILLAVLHGPFFAASAWMLHHSGNGWFPPLIVRRLWEGPSFPTTYTSELGWIGGSVAAGLFGEMLFAVGVSVVMREWLNGSDPTAPDVLRSVARRLPSIVSAWLVAFVLKSIGAAVCVVGLLLFVPYLSILAPVMAFERGGAFRSITRSRELVNRSAERALFLTLIAPVLSFAIPWALETGAGRAVGNVEEFSTIMAAVVTLVLVVARTATTVLLYLDIRVRTEGLDLALRAPQVLGTTS